MSDFARDTDVLISRQAAYEMLTAYYHHRTDLQHKALKEALERVPSAQPEPRWIPVKMRPMDSGEREYWEDQFGEKLDDEDAVMFDCPMPEDGQEVWVCSKCGNVRQDTCIIDDGIGLEGNGDWLDIVAWMPFERPEPWKGEV